MSPLHLALVDAQTTPALLLLRQVEAALAPMGRPGLARGLIVLALVEGSSLITLPAGSEPALIDVPEGVVDQLQGEISALALALQEVA